MATPSWIGNAVATTDTWTITVGGTWVAADTITITGLSKTIVLTVGTTVTVAGVCISLSEAYNGSNFTDTTASALPKSPRTVLPEFAELTATYTSTTVVLTANTAGKPTPTFTVSKSSASGTVSISHTVTATGPNYWDNTANWSTGSVPASTDDVTIDRPVSILYGLAQSAVTLTSLTITPRFTSACQIGLPVRNAAGYEEWRATELAISATTVNITTGSGLIKINYGSVANTTNVWSTGTTIETGRKSCQLRGTSTSNVLRMLSLVVNGGGTLDVGFGSNGETAALATCQQDAGDLVIGSNVSSFTTFTQNGTSATAAIYCAVTTATSTGTTSLYSGAITTLTANSGTVYSFSTSTYTTVNLNNSAIFNADGAIASQTITTLNMNDTSSFVDTADRITFTNPIAWKGRLTLSAA